MNDFQKRRGRPVVNAERDEVIFAAVYCEHHRRSISLEEAFAAVAEDRQLSEERIKVIYRRLSQTREGRRIKADMAMRLTNEGVVGRALPPRRRKEREAFERRWSEGEARLASCKIGFRDMELRAAKQLQAMNLYTAEKQRLRDDDEKRLAEALTRDVLRIVESEAQLNPRCKHALRKRLHHFFRLKKGC